MTSDQRNEFLAYLNKHMDDEETIHQAVFRIDCFVWRDREHIDWINTYHPKDVALFKAFLTFPKINKSVPYLTKIKDLKQILKEYVL